MLRQSHSTITVCVDFGDISGFIFNFPLTFHVRHKDQLAGHVTCEVCYVTTLFLI